MRGKDRVQLLQIASERHVLRSCPNCNSQMLFIIVKTFISSSLVPRYTLMLIPFLCVHTHTCCCRSNLEKHGAKTGIIGCKSLFIFRPNEGSDSALLGTSKRVFNADTDKLLIYHFPSGFLTRDAHLVPRHENQGAPLRDLTGGYAQFSS